MINWQLSKTGYPLISITYSYRGLRCRPIEVKYFLKLPLTSYYFSNDRRLKFIFQFIWNMLCLCAAQLRFWFQTDLERENSATYYRQGRQLLLTLLTMVTRWARSTSIFFCSDWSKFDRWVHAKNLCSILNLVYFDSWSWQSFVSTCDVFSRLFPLMHKMKFSCYQESSVIHG